MRFSILLLISCVSGCSLVCGETGSVNYYSVFHADDFYALDRSVPKFSSMLKKSEVEDVDNYYKVHFDESGKLRYAFRIWNSSEWNEFMMFDSFGRVIRSRNPEEEVHYIYTGSEVNRVYLSKEKIIKKEKYYYVDGYLERVEVIGPKNNLREYFIYNLEKSKFYRYSVDGELLQEGSIGRWR